MPRPLAARRATAILAAASALALAPASPAAAEPTWYDGSSENSTVPLCFSGTPATGVVGKAWLQADPAAPTRVGDVFYASVTAGTVGSGCVDPFVDPEVILPAGVELAVSAQQPIRCYSDDITTGARTEVTPAQGCGQAPTRGFHGLQLLNTSRPDGLWPLPAGKAIDIWFPLRSTRPLAGGLLLSPGCGRPGANGGGRPPCRPDQAGDNLQIGVWVIDGYGDPWLAPQIGLQVAAAPAGAVAGTTTTAPAPTPAPTGTAPAGTPAPAAAPAPRLLTAPRSLRIRTALRGGIPVTVAVPAARARVTATLSAPRLGRLATVRRSGVRAGSLRLRVKPTRTAARRLRRARTVTATLRVTVRVPGRRASSASSRIRLSR